MVGNHFCLCRMREEENANTMQHLCKVVVVLLIRFCFVGGASAAIYAWSQSSEKVAGKRTFSSRIFWIIFSMLVMVSCLQILNNWSKTGSYYTSTLLELSQCGPDLNNDCSIVPNTYENKQFLLFSLNCRIRA